MRKSTKYSAFTLSFIALIAPLLIGSTTPAAADTANCGPKVAIMTFRGSGEVQESNGYQYTLNPDVATALGQTSIASNGWEGDGGTISRLLTSYYANNTVAEYSDPTQVKLINVGVADNNPDSVESYNAVRPSGALALTNVLKSSVDGGIAGATILNQLNASKPAGCYHTKAVLLGYSQGAMAARTMDFLDSSDVVGVLLAGDTYEWGAEPGTYGTAGDSNSGLYRVLEQTIQGTYINGQNLPVLSDNFYGTSFDFGSNCYKEDSFCNFDYWDGSPAKLIGDNNPAHGNYYKNTDASSLQANTIDLENFVQDAYGLSNSNSPSKVKTFQSSQQVATTASLDLTYSGVGATNTAVVINSGIPNSGDYDFSYSYDNGTTWISTGEPFQEHTFQEQNPTVLVNAVNKNDGSVISDSLTIPLNDPIPGQANSTLDDRSAAIVPATNYGMSGQTAGNIFRIVDSAKSSVPFGVRIVAGSLSGSAALTATPIATSPAPFSSKQGFYDWDVSSFNLPVRQHYTFIITTADLKTQILSVYKVA